MQDILRTLANLAILTCKFFVVYVVVERNSDWSAGDNYIPSAKYWV